MSWQTVAWVYTFSPFENAGPFSVHLAMADVVNPEHGNEFWMSLDKLARKSRTSRPTAKRTVDDLIERGLLRVLEERPGGTTRYRMMFPDDAPMTYNPRHGDPPYPEDDLAHGDRGTPRVTREEVARGDRGGRAPRATNKKGASTEPKSELEGESDALFAIQDRDKATDKPRGFEDFWTAYPARDGSRKGSKKTARAAWDKLPAAGRAAAMVGVVHYAAGQDTRFVMNADRWLRDQHFDDWQTPGKPRARPGGPAVDLRGEGPQRRGVWSDD